MTSILIIETLSSLTKVLSSSFQTYLVSFVLLFFCSLPNFITMASVVHRLLRKPSAIKIFTTFQNAPSSGISFPLFSQHYNGVENIASTEKDNFPIFQPFLTYPSFPFGCHLNSIPPTGTDELDSNEVVPDNSPMVWADSVKKKRKKKMNKHKYKKLRKSLG